MADYKDILSGTLGALVGKVREAAENSPVRSVYEQGVNRTRAYGRIAKLSLEVNGAHEELSRVYAEIGRLYYEQAKDAPEGYFAPLFAQAGEITRSILDKEAEVASLKEALEAQKNEPDIDVEISGFEDVVNATESDGTAADT